METSLMQTIDERTRLAGANRLEILLFSLGKGSDTGREEVFGINVFKIREVMQIPEITQAPDMPPGVKGMVCLRGQMIPVIDMAHYVDLNIETPPQILIVTEFNRSTQGFLVDSVEQILRMEWNEIKIPPPMMANTMGGLVTAVTELKDGRIVMVLDVEKILADTSMGLDDESVFEGVEELDSTATIMFADDSSVARNQISRTLDKLGIKYFSAKNGEEAWERMKAFADEAEERGIQVKDIIQLLLTDIEMPGMDGYVLTKKVKEDPRFQGIPIVMHSSLSAEANITIGKSVGVDAYVPKFDPRELTKTIEPFLNIDLSKK